MRRLMGGGRNRLAAGLPARTPNRIDGTASIACHGSNGSTTRDITLRCGLRRLAMSGRRRLATRAGASAVSVSRMP